MTSTSQTSQADCIQHSMEFALSFNTDISTFDIDEYLEDFDLEAAMPGFEERVSPDFTPGIELGVELCLADLTPGTEELSFKEICPQAQSAGVEAQEPLAEGTQLTGAASAGSAVGDLSVPSLSGSTAVQPLEPGVQESEAYSVIGEGDMAKSELLTKEEQKEVKKLRFLRHKLQRAFLSADKSPKPREMDAMSAYFDRLESVTSPSKTVLAATKIVKVFNRIMRLNKIPKDDDFHFKKRAARLSEKWTVILESEDQPAATSNAQPGPEHTPKSLVIDLTESSDSEVSLHSTSNQGVCKMESLSSSTTSDELGSGVAIRSKSSLTPDTLANERKRKHSKTGEDRCETSSESSPKLNRVAKSSRRQTRPKTTVQQYLNNEILFMEGSLREIEEMIKENAEEEKSVQAKRVRLVSHMKEMIEEKEEEERLIQKNKVRLMDLKEKLLARSAQEEKVTREWEQSR